MRKLLLFAFTLVIMLCSACNENTGMLNTEKSAEQNAGITIYYLKDHNFVAEWLNRYNSIYPNVKVDSLVFDNYDAYKNALQTELMAGEGPDIIYINVYSYNSLTKTAKTNVFFDMQSLMEKDKDFNFQDYNNKIFDFGIINGKRYFVPINYNMFMYWTIDKKLDEYDINIKNDSYEELILQAEKFINRPDTVSDKKYFFAGEIVPHLFIFSSGLKLIDYDKNEAYFNTRDFINILGYYKKFSELTASETEYNKFKNRAYGMIESDTALAEIKYSLLNPRALWMEYSSVRQMFNEDLSFHMFLNYTGGQSYTALPYYVFAINNNSKCKTEAYNFIKMILSKELQVKIGETMPYLIPANNMAVKELYEKYKEQGVKEKNIFSSELGQVKSLNLPDPIVDRAINILENIDCCPLIDADIALIMDSEVNRYLNGEQTAENCARAIQNKVLLYLNE